MGIVNDYFSFQNGYAFKSVDFTENGEYKIIKIKKNLKMDRLSSLMIQQK